MTNRKPALLKFSAYTLIAIGALFSLTSLSIFRGGSIGLIGIMFILFPIAAGIGLLKKQKWARVLAIITFLLLLIGVIGSLTTSSPTAGMGTAFYIGFWSAYLIIIGGSGLGLYAMIFDKSVKHYLNQSDRND
jgi:phosphotransferase system  glucose/maltose/N-acetylglucosamine-specific IIC component